MVILLHHLQGLSNTVESLTSLLLPRIPFFADLASMEGSRGL